MNSCSTESASGPSYPASPCTQCRTLEGRRTWRAASSPKPVGAHPDAIVLDTVVPELAPVLGPVAEARAAEQQAIAAAVHELVDTPRVSQGDAGRLLGMFPSEVARFTPPHGSATTGPEQLIPVPAQAISPARPICAIPDDGAKAEADGASPPGDTAARPDHARRSRPLLHRTAVSFVADS